MHLYRVYDLDLDDYRDLDVPIPDTDPEYRRLLDQSRADLRTAGDRDRGAMP